MVKINFTFEYYFKWIEPWVCFCNTFVYILFYIQREAVEALIQELPKFRLKAVPTDCSECPICLEEFRVGNEVSIYLQNKILFYYLPVHCLESNLLEHL